MSIQIIRNENGNCINFRGSSAPVYYNACLSGEVDPSDDTLVNVVNDIATNSSPDTVYVFYQIPYTEWRDADDNPFASAQDVVDYIDLVGNVAIGTDVAAGYQGVWDASTNTPDVSGLTPENGDWFYVSVAGNNDPNVGATSSSSSGSTNTYNINDIIKYDENSASWQLIKNETVRVDQLQQEVEEIVYSTESALFNTNASIYADGDQATSDPNNLESGWYYKNLDSSSAGKINWYYVGNVNPQNTMTLGTMKSMYAVIKVLATGVPYFTLYTQPTGGAADAAVWYRSRLNYIAAEGTIDGYVDQQVLLYWGEDPSDKFLTIPHIELTLDESTSNGPQSSDENVLFGALSTSSTAPEGTYEFIAKTLGFKNNTHITEYLLDTNDPVNVAESTNVGSNQEIDFTRDATNTSIIFGHTGASQGVNTIIATLRDDGTITIRGIGDDSNGGGHDDHIQYITNLNHEMVTITGSAPASQTPVGVVNALNALFTVNPLGAGYEPATIIPTLAGAATTLNFAEGATPITGTPTHLYTTDADTSSGHGARVWTDETIDAAGEFFDVKITGGSGSRWILGLVNQDDTTTFTELTNDSGNGNNGLTWGNAFYDYGSYNAPWTTYGRGQSGVNMGLSYGPGWNGSTDSQMRYNTEVQDNLDNMDDVLFRVGINDQGYIYVSYYDAGRTNDFIVTARTSKVAQAGNWGLVVKLWSGNATLVEGPTRSAVDPAAPILAYRYIESPDGSFHYPLFATEEEANYYDSENGGSGTSHQHVYVDEPTFTTWYMPDTLSYMDESSAPSNTSEITYTEIPTNADAQYAPTQYTDNTLTVNEGSSLNIQVTPQGATWTTAISGLPSGVTYDGYSLLQGNAPAVTGDNVANPSDTYTITVSRTNAYGTSTGTLTLVVNNMTAPTVDTGDWDSSTGTITAGVLQEDSSADLDITLSEGERLIIPKEWVDAHIDPNNLDVDEKVYFGTLRSDATTSTIEIGDFAGCFRFAGRAGTTSHEVRLNDQLGSSVGNQTFLNTGASVYDYALELYSGDLYLIACNVNNINTEPAVAEGGSFTRTYNCGAISDNSLSSPLTITLATGTGATVDLDDSLTTEDVTKITIPSPPAPTILTSWDKALDFSGSNEHLKQVSQSILVNALRMGGKSTTVPANSDSSKTSNDSEACPWATTIVFKADGNNSNQHIWNQGEGAGSTDDNIYVRQDASGYIYFGWGRQGALNECRIGDGFNTNTQQWFGLYIAHKGTRLSGANATATNLADAFDIRFMKFNYTTSVWEIITGGYGDVVGNRSTTNNWNSGSTGGRMDRTVAGDFTIGGRGSNRNFHGKVASMVVTTLRSNFAMPTDAEIKLMITDPKKWEDDYRVGQFVRWAYSTSITTYNPSNFTYGYGPVQMWLMGDGSSDSYANGIRNEVYPSDQNYTKLQLNSMVSNDIQTVSIPGLS
jgi:hypothetical protein